MAYQLGIDLGTTYTAAAVARDGQVEMQTLSDHGFAMPSVVYYGENESWLFGDVANRRALSEPQRVARGFKRRIGDDTPLVLGGSLFSPEQLSSRLLMEVLRAVTAREQGPPDFVALTHPANWGPFKKERLVNVARMAGLTDQNKLLLLTEPEAAATHYAARERLEPGEVVAVYDLGGGTFDAAVLRRTEDGFTIVGDPNEGIERMGGMDFDDAVLTHVTGHLEGVLQRLDANDPLVKRRTAALRAQCVEAKEALSKDAEALIPVSLPNVETEVRLTRSEFEGMIRPQLEETMQSMLRALRSVPVKPKDVHAVLLVGGSSQIPLIGQLISKEIGCPVAIDVHPKNAVALGAARAADAVANPPATKFRSALVMALATGPTPAAGDSQCVGFLVVDHQSTPPVTLRARDEPTSAASAEELAARVLAFRAQRTAGFTDRGLGPVLLAGQPGLERRFVMSTGYGPIEMLERYGVAGGRALVLACPEAGRAVADTLCLRTATLAPQSWFECRFEITHPPDWTATEQVVLRRSGTGHSVSAEHSVIGDVDPDNWRRQLLEALLRELPGAVMAGHTQGQVLGRLPGDIITVNWTQQGTPMVTKLGVSVLDGRGYAVRISVPYQDRAVFPSLAAQAQLHPEQAVAPVPH